MKKRKLIIFAIAIVVILAIFVIYTQLRDDYSNVTVTTNEIMDNIFQNLKEDNFSQNTELDDSGISETYGIDISKIDNYIIKVPIMNIRADEIAIIKIKEIKDLSYIVNKLKERANVVQNTFNKYLQDQYNLAVDHIIVIKGKYILFSISEDNEQIENIFNSYFVVKTEKQ